MTKKVFGGAVTALEVALGAARHVAWYLSYQVGGTTRESDDKRK